MAGNLRSPGILFDRRKGTGHTRTTTQMAQTVMTKTSGIHIYLIIFPFYFNHFSTFSKGENGRKEGRKEERKEGRKEGRKEERKE